MLTIATAETAACEPFALSSNTVPATATTAPRVTSTWVRTLARKWEMIAVIALMAASAAYGTYALFFSTGF